MAQEYDRKVSREKASEHGKQRVAQAIIKEATTAFRAKAHKQFDVEAKGTDSTSYLRTVADMTGSS